MIQSPFLIKAELDTIDEDSDQEDDETNNRYSINHDRPVSKRSSNPSNLRPRTSTLDAKPNQKVINSATKHKQMMHASNDSFDYFGITQEKESKHEEYGLATKVKLPEFLLSRE